MQPSAAVNSGTDMALSASIVSIALTPGALANPPQ